MNLMQYVLLNQYTHKCMCKKVYILCSEYDEDAGVVKGTHQCQIKLR